MIVIKELVPPLMLGIYIHTHACICSRCVATKRTHLNCNIILVVYCTIPLDVQGLISSNAGRNYVFNIIVKVLCIMTISDATYITIKHNN